MSAPDDRARLGRLLWMLVSLGLLLGLAPLVYYEAHPDRMWTPANGRRADSLQAAIPRR